MIIVLSICLKWSSAVPIIQPVNSVLVPRLDASNQSPSGVAAPDVQSPVAIPSTSFIQALCTWLTNHLQVGAIEMIDNTNASSSVRLGTKDNSRTFVFITQQPGMTNINPSFESNPIIAASLTALPIDRMTSATNNSNPVSLISSTTDVIAAMITSSSTETIQPTATVLSVSTDLTLISSTSTEPCVTPFTDSITTDTITTTLSSSSTDSTTVTPQAFNIIMVSSSAPAQLLTDNPTSSSTAVNSQSVRETNTVNVPTPGSNSLNMNLFSGNVQWQWPSNTADTLIPIGSSFSSFNDSPCSGFTCGSNAECLLRNFRAVCQCLRGFTGDPAVSCVSSSTNIPPILNRQSKFLHSIFLKINQ